MNAIEKALAKDKETKKKQRELGEIQNRLVLLTPREYEVLQWIITGMLNKQIGSSIGTTERTIKAHRAQIMRKLEIVSVAELVRLAEKAGIAPAKQNPGL